MQRARPNPPLVNPPSIAGLVTAGHIAVLALAGGGCTGFPPPVPYIPPMVCEDFGSGLDLKLTEADVFRDAQRVPSLALLDSDFRAIRRRHLILHPSNPPLAVTIHASSDLPLRSWAAPVAAIDAGGATRLHPVALRSKAGGEAAGGPLSTGHPKCSIHVVLREDPQAVALSDLEHWGELVALAAQHPGAALDPSR